MRARASSTAMIYAALLMSVASCDSGPSGRAETASPWSARSDSTEVRVLSDAPSICHNCVQFTLEATLGDTSGPGYLVHTDYVVRDSVGNYWLGQYKDMIKVFDKAGNFVRQVGRQGSGPGEFLVPMPTYADAGGLIHIVDPSNVRETVMRPDFQVHTIRGFPSVMRAAPLPDERRYVATGAPPSPDGIGLPLHITDGRKIAHSFGRSRTGIVSPFKLYRVLATDRASRIYSTWPFGYLIEVWTTYGHRITGFQGPTLSDRAPQPGVFSDDHPPVTKVAALYPDEKDRLWVLILCVKDDWREHMRVVRRSSGRSVLQPINSVSELYTSRIDVVDLNSGSIIARSERREHFRAFVGEGLIVEARLLEDATPQVGIWSLTLQPPQER